MEDRSLNLAPASVADYRELARKKLPRQLFDYIDGAAYRETTMRANVEDLRNVRLRQRILRDVSDIDLSVEVLGKPLTFGNLEAAVPGARSPAEFKDWVDGQFDPSVTWDDLAWVRQHWPGKLVLKGILDPEDANEAVEVGADAIVVSNHGGWRR
ncbi:MAG: alpha-hydroxy-acid oxidizing protein [Deltaproteobacteria bacterium]|nr:alpha-hydroxy-acid oxidizing protein [Deltaproteobacteria bacterium]